MLITFEGIEGVGKTTHLKWVADYLQAQEQSVVLTREPGGTPMGEEMRNIILAHRHEYVVPMTELLLMFAARAQHIETIIRPALQKNQWVLCDRFIDASYAYQGGGRGISLDIIAQLEKLVLNNCQPNLTFIFDAPAELGLSRVKSRNQIQDRIETEKIEFFERVRQTYLKRVENNKDRYCIVDATKTLEAVQEVVATKIKKLLEKARAVY
jgi:dTMP kinase